MYEFNYKVVVQTRDPEESDNKSEVEDLDELSDNTLEVLERLLQGEEVDLLDYSVEAVRIFGPVNLNGGDGKLLKEWASTESFRLEPEE